MQRESIRAQQIQVDIDLATVVHKIDLYHLHRCEVSVPLEEVIGAMLDLARAGKVRHLGLIEVTDDELRAAHAIHPICAVQSWWSLWSRNVERRAVPALQNWCRLCTVSPLGRGFLTGTIASSAEFEGDWRSGLSQFRCAAVVANHAVVAAVRAIAKEHDATPAQVALAWLRSVGNRTRPAGGAYPGHEAADERGREHRFVVAGSR